VEVEGGQKYGRTVSGFCSDDSTSDMSSDGSYWIKRSHNPNFRQQQQLEQQQQQQQQLLL